MADDINTTVEVDEDNGDETGIEPRFTQDDVDRIVKQRLARQAKDLPTDEELAGYRSWKELQKTEADKLKDITKERDEAKSSLSKAQAQIEQYEREKYLIKKGVPEDDLDYYGFKIGQMVTEDTTFEEKADEYLKDKLPKRARVDLGGSLGGSAKKMTPNEQMNALIRGKF